MSGKRGTTRAVCAAGCVLASLWIARLAGAGELDPRAREIFAALHVELELQDIARSAVASLASPMSALPPGDGLLLRSAVESGFDPRSLSARALEVFSARLDAPHARAALAWLARPETQSLLARAAAADAGVAAAHADTMRSDGEGETRRDALLRHFDREAGRAARAERCAQLVFTALLRAANPWLPAWQRYSQAEIEDLLEGQREIAASTPGDAHGLRHRYAGIPTREIETAVAFLDSPSGAWLRHERDAAVEEALTRAARTTAASLVEAFGSGAPQTPLLVARAPRP